jgi:homogentisate 1,2-dioxygenase
MRWLPIKYPKESKSFIESISTMCGAGDPAMKDGLSIHTYAFNKNMDHTAFYNSDGDLLIVP